MSNGKLIVHMIGNAHLDPVWMWSWPDGVDEAIATCRTACDLLDEYPELQITRGEAWIYYQVQRIAPPLFKRIAAHITSGRWHVVNGWWIQPDCNLPRAESFLKQSEIGGRFLKEHLGIQVTVGYNVDSFGHCAMLPTFLRQGGKDAYIFTRPGANEMDLPGNLFRWRSPAGDEVLAFRAASYATGVQGIKGCLERELARVAPGIEHTVCMYGIGDHGGGPTRKAVEWIQRHRHYAEHVELRFSNLRGFFDSVAPIRASLPVVEGELNPHAIGCYAVVRNLKREVRRSESLLLQAEQMATTETAPRQRKALDREFEDAWRTLLFNQFHDILCGSSIAPACQDALDELGSVKRFARDYLVASTRKRNLALPPCPRQRVVIDNPGPRPWQGQLEYEPWLWTINDRAKAFTLLDGANGRVLTQDLIPQAASDQMRRILFTVNLPPGGRQVLELRRLLTPQRTESARLRIADQTLTNGVLSATCGQNGLASITCEGKPFLGENGITLSIVADDTDTWSHGVVGFAGETLAQFSANAPWAALENGPLRSELVNEFTALDATLRWSVSLADNETALRLKLRLHWRGQGKLVRMTIPAGFAVKVRRDGTPGTVSQRGLDGKEYPVMDILSLAGEKRCLTLVSPDVYSAAVQPTGVANLTLLRSPFYANEGGSALPPHNAYQATDQGVHEFEIVLMPTAAFAENAALDEAYKLNTPPLISETTFGMPSGCDYDSVLPPMEDTVPGLPDGAWLPEELLAFAENPQSLALVPSGKLCRRWPGERLLTCPDTIRLKLPAPMNMTCRVSLAYLAGGAFGALQVLVGGRETAVIRGKDGKTTPGLAVFKAQPDPSGSFIDLEIRRVGGRSAAIGFIQVISAYQDIRAESWRVAGPYLFSDVPDWHGNDGDGMEAMAKLVFPPEQCRDINAQEHGKPLWRPLQGQDDYIDFHACTGRTLGSIHYALTCIKSSRRQRVRLSFGMDYWIKIWLNGKLALDCLCVPGFPVKGKFSAEVEFNEGWNDLLVKVASGSTGNGFWLAVPDDGSLECVTSGNGGDDGNR